MQRCGRFRSGPSSFEILYDTHKETIMVTLSIIKGVYVVKGTNVFCNVSDVRGRVEVGKSTRIGAVSENFAKALYGGLQVPLRLVDGDVQQVWSFK